MATWKKLPCHHIAVSSSDDTLVALTWICEESACKSRCDAESEREACCFLPALPGGSPASFGFVPPQFFSSSFLLVPGGEGESAPRDRSSDSFRHWRSFPRCVLSSISPPPYPVGLNRCFTVWRPLRLHSVMAFFFFRPIKIRSFPPRRLTPSRTQATSVMDRAYGVVSKALRRV